MRLALLTSTALLLLAAGACDDLNLGGNGGGNTQGNAPPAAGSDIEILGLVTRYSVPGESTPTTFAQLAVLSLRADPPRFLGGVSDARLQAGSLEVALAGNPASGVFTVNSQRSALRYIPGADYTFRFSITDAAGTRQNITAETTAPETVPSLELDPLLVGIAGQPLTITLRNLGDGGIVAVSRLEGTSATTTFSSFTFTTPDTLASALDSMIAVAANPTFEIPGTAFPWAGRYRIEAHGYAIASERLGARGMPGPNSWVAVGELVWVDLDILID